MRSFCSYPKCSHAKGRSPGCKMHLLPSNREKCISWMKACHCEGTPRKIPRRISVCSCHFVGGNGPNQLYPNPITFDPEDGHLDKHKKTWISSERSVLRSLQTYSQISDDRCSQNEEYSRAFASRILFMSSERKENLGISNGTLPVDKTCRDSWVHSTHSSATPSKRSIVDETVDTCKSHFKRPHIETKPSQPSHRDFQQCENDSLNFGSPLKTSTQTTQNKTHKGTSDHFDVSYSIFSPPGASSTKKSHELDSEQPTAGIYSGFEDLAVPLSPITSRHKASLHENSSLHENTTIDVSSCEVAGAHHGLQDFSVPISQESTQPYHLEDSSDASLFVTGLQAEGSQSSLHESPEFNINKVRKYVQSVPEGHDKPHSAIGVQCNLPMFSYEKCKNWSEHDFTYLTGVSQTSFEVLYEFLGGDAVCSKLKYDFDANTPRSERGTTHHSDRGKLFLTLVRLRRGYPLWDMALFFNLSQSVLSKIFYTWIRFMSIKFQSLEAAEFVSVSGQQKNKPDCYAPFPNLRGVVDSFEVKIQKSADMEQQSNTFSPYKCYNTAKFMLVTSVYGGVSFISHGMEGSVSDRKLFLKSGILDHLNAGEAVMADRGFDVEVDLDRIGVELIIPPFLGKREAFTSRELFLQKAIAAARIHVETCIGYLKHFRLIRFGIPNTMLDILSDMVRVCAFLVNFRDPFIKWDSMEK